MGYLLNFLNHAGSFLTVSVSLCFGIYIPNVLVSNFHFAVYLNWAFVLAAIFILTCECNSLLSGNLEQPLTDKSTGMLPIP